MPGCSSLPGSGIEGRQVAWGSSLSLVFWRRDSHHCGRSAAMEEGLVCVHEVPETLYHYYERTRGPFVHLSDLPYPEAERILEAIRKDGVTFAARRAPEYLAIRRGLEEQVRALFIAKGGRPIRQCPHYLTLGPCPWLLDWYRDGCELALPMAAIDSAVVSFTYGDMFPAMRLRDAKPYRGQVYRWDELPDLVARYGVPQDWNHDGSRGPERYIEAQLWDEAPVARMM